jgi:hypothetical protein
MPTIDELISDPVKHRRALLALQEVLEGTDNGLRRERYLARRQQALDALRASTTWVIVDDRNEAVRIDGVRLEPRPPTTPQAGGIWALMLPLVESWQQVGFGIPVEAADLVSAVAEVDRRFPLPAWWAEADQAGRPWRHEKATP